MKKLTEVEIEKKLKDLPDWDYYENALHSEFEFENFKKRTAKERIELYKTAGENILTSLLPILDDFERSIKANTDKEDEGVQLIYNKFKNVIETTNFENMKKLKEKKGFIEARINHKTGKKSSFFNLGPKNDWKTNLEDKIRAKIEKAFQKEMIELGYL